MKLFLLLLVFIPAVGKANKPLYEFGAAMGMGYVRDYPGADQGRWRYIGVPSFIYRGHILRNDQRGTRARFFKNEKLDLDLSFGASFPANSKDNKAREGMDDLDWLAEVGPRINIKLLQTSTQTLRLELPIRFVFSTDFAFTQQRGQRFYPQIDLDQRIDDEYRLNLSFKMNWATEDLTDYFYQVEQKDVTLDRPEFDAKSGYVGSAVSLSLFYNDGRLLYGAGSRYSRFDGSTNQNSPLFKDKEALTVFFFFNYFFYQSKEKGSI